MTVASPPAERVLSTLNVDGTRRWLRPKLSPGRFWQKRRITAYLLMFVFFVIPYIRMNGKPLILLDIPRREFTILGTTFLPTDTLLFMLLFVTVGIGIFLLTALFGRVWCGWGCPQTVYLEFLFRPLERLIEGGRSASLALDRKRGLHPRRVLKYAVYGVLSLFLAHTFLAYFVGVERLAQWIQLSPVEHPTAFAVMAVTASAIFFDFTYFREQTCLVACPYGRLQSVLLDRQSLIVGYDVKRGEPRQRGLARAPAAGDCIDCGACTLTCPTGIDIRDGLQMECIHCTQCADACDEIMHRIGKPAGLIGYTTRDRLDGKPRRILRPRVVLYPIALTVSAGLLVFFLATQREADVTVLRGIGAPFSIEADGRVLNQIRIRVRNRSAAEQAYRISIDGVPAEIITPENPLRVRPGELRTTSVFVRAAASAFEGGRRGIVVRLSDGQPSGFSMQSEYIMLGPSDRPGAAQ